MATDKERDDTSSDETDTARAYDRERKAKLAYDEIIVLRREQIETLERFRSRANVLVATTVAAAGVLSFSDQVQDGPSWSWRFITFWVGVIGLILMLGAIVRMYLPVAWLQNPGGIPQGACDGRDEASKWINHPETSYTEMLSKWCSYHQRNLEANRAVVDRMAHCTIVAIVGIALLLVSWMWNAHVIADDESPPDRIVVTID